MTFLTWAAIVWAIVSWAVVVVALVKWRIMRDDLRAEEALSHARLEKLSIQQKEAAARERQAFTRGRLSAKSETMHR
jgi:hypothetical protein